ncbi:MAG: Rieske 2Fe-2S domain-containing protein [Acidimicrobiia bacterium]|nr:Rieske 2Fe-2S domain-containing protein [Acidimicrobiia bacterium]
MTNATSWHRVAGLDDIPSGRVTTVTVGTRVLALTHFEGEYGALDNRCPHQGGPLGEGSIERGWLRCPWHGYDYNPLDGSPPEGFDDAPTSYPTEVREDGVYVELPPESERGRTVGDVMVETMTNWGVRAVFGMVGHSNLGIADSLRLAEERGDLRYFGIRHEGAAAFAATAYGKLTGGLAACFAIAGPGSTNLLTGLYDAKKDRAPVLALSGQVPSRNVGRGAFQDLDLASAFADVARYGAVVHADGDHAELMSLACKTAIVERDVAHLIFPDEVQVRRSDEKPSGPEGRVGARDIRPPEGEFARACSLLRSAKSPVFVVGAGARHDMGPIIALAEQLNIPVMTTFKAKGQISDRHRLGCGVLGRSGTPIASWFMNESDLMVVWGASFSHHTGISEHKPLIQVDRDPMAIGRFHSIEIGLIGDVATTAQAMAASISDPFADPTERIAERWELWRAEKASRRQDDRGAGINSALIFEELTATAPDDAVICVDVGNNTYSFGRYFETSNQSILMSGYLGSIGFALPAAMGAWAAVGDTRKVLAVCGDGGLAQYAMELTTLVQYEMDVTVILLSNSELGKISKEQRAAQHPVWQTRLVNPDFADVARLCGAMGTRVIHRADLATALESAIAHPGPALVDVDADVVLI